MSLAENLNILDLCLSDFSILRCTDSNLFINEFMASNVLAYGNVNGDYEDWIEI